MTFKTKLIAVAILPIVLISFATLWLIDTQAQRLAETQSRVVEEMIRSSKQAELQNYVKLARAAVEPFYQWDYVSRLQAQKQVADMITNMNFGDDGYFFVSRSNGRPLDNPLLSELPGNDMFADFGSEVKLLSGSGMGADHREGFLYRYSWQKPTTGQRAEKIGMSVYLKNWDWVIGSGLYTDDISAQIGQVQQQLEENMEQTRWVLLAMAAGAIALTSFLLTFVRFSEQRIADRRLKELASEIVDAQENERKRVSTELHDGISQLLVSAQYSLDLANENAKRSAKVREPIQKSMKAISTAISEIRRISMALRPSILDDMGLASAIKSLGDDFEAQTGISTVTEVENIGLRLDDRQKTTLYRVAQEALANVAKHANATETRLTLQKVRNGVQLVISDNGTGLSTNSLKTARQGMGFRNIRERVESHNGRFSANSSGKTGTQLDIFIPSTNNTHRKMAASSTQKVLQTA
ncbi:MAG: cache domain-containing protein [Pseudomonadota bacterium]